MTSLRPTRQRLNLGARLQVIAASKKAAEGVAMKLLGERLGVHLAPRRVPLEGGGRLELDGACENPPILVEAWAHQGAPKAAQKAKIMTDAMRLLLASRTLRTEPKLILLLTDRESGSALMGRSWMAQALRELAIGVEVVELPEEVKEAVLRAQTRQYR
jgi:hypothetical protein